MVHTGKADSLSHSECLGMVTWGVLFWSCFPLWGRVLGQHLGFPVPFYRFFFWEGSPTKMDYSGYQPILTSLLEDLGMLPPPDFGVGQPTPCEPRKAPDCGW